jgi:hypothetical protein
VSGRHRTTSPAVVQYIQQQTVLGHGPTAIRRALERGDGPRGAEVPAHRTIQYIAREVRPVDDSDTWSPGSADLEEAALVMPVLVTLVRAGQMTSLTTATARWIARIRRIAPELSPLDSLLFAGRYLAAERGGQGYAMIDLALARALAARRPPGRTGRASVAGAGGD